jgi:hypothetical protein
MLAALVLAACQGAPPPRPEACARVATPSPAPLPASSPPVVASVAVAATGSVAVDEERDLVCVPAQLERAVAGEIVVSGEIVVVDGRTRAVVGRIPGGAGLVAVDARRRRVHSSDVDASGIPQLLVTDTGRQALVRSATIGQPGGPLAVDERAGRVPGPGLLPGDTVRAAAVDASARRLHVTVSGLPESGARYRRTDPVLVLDAAAGSLLARLSVGVGAGSMAANPRTHRVYVANLVSRTLSVIQG